MYILTCRSTEQHKPVPQCSILLFDPLWKTTQAKEEIKGKRWQLRLAQRPSRLTWETCCVQGKREKTHQTTEEKAEIFKLSARPPSTSCCVPLNYLLISLSCELPVPQLCLVLHSLITHGPRVWPDYSNNVYLACGVFYIWTFVFRECFKLMSLIMLCDGIFLSLLCSFPVSTVWHFFTIP